jgi:hypothetical protein
MYVINTSGRCLSQNLCSEVYVGSVFYFVNVKFEEGKNKFVYFRSLGLAGILKISIQRPSDLFAFEEGLVIMEKFSLFCLL